MKKILLISLAAIMVAAMSIPASAVENEFGGYWRTRAINEIDFDGTDSGSNPYVDTRTRLYYTAKFNENLKFVNKFEFDTKWGDQNAGDIGADGDNFELKNSYVDFTMGSLNFKVGIQGATLARGFLFDDDFSGVVASYNTDSMSLPFIWVKAIDEDAGAEDDITTTDFDESKSLDYYILSPTFNLSETLSVNPYLVYAKQETTETNLYYIGADVNAKAGDADVWCTLIYEGGETYDYDNSAYLVAFGADAGLIHGQFFYASGDDDGSDDDNDAFSGPAGLSYYWSEIMGYGIFDNTASNNAPADAISNVMAVNVGTTVKPMDKLTLTADLWYAQLAEDVEVNGSMENELGFEIDLGASYELMENLTLDVVAAYLIAGDATGEEDPMEIGTQLSLKF